MYRTAFRSKGYHGFIKYSDLVPSSLTPIRDVTYQFRERSICRVSIQNFSWLSTFSVIYKPKILKRREEDIGYHLGEKRMVVRKESFTDVDEMDKDAPIVSLPADRKQENRFDTAAFNVPRV